VLAQCWIASLTCPHVCLRLPLLLLPCVLFLQCPGLVCAPPRSCLGCCAQDMRPHILAKAHLPLDEVRQQPIEANLLGCCCLLEGRGAV
jgi:hypothetical protein